MGFERGDGDAAVRLTLNSTTYTICAASVNVTRLMFLGAIADDVTGGTDLASVLRRGGLTVVQTLDTLAIPPGADAVVVSLKIRTAAAGLARSSAGQAAEALRAAGAEQIYFKYCSTFDSTDAGNIGPVIDELLARLHGDLLDRMPGVSGAGAHGLRRAPLRRQSAPVRFFDAAPPADADDRREPGAGTRPADALAGGAGRTGHHRGGAARGRRAGSPSSPAPATRLPLSTRCSIAISMRSPRRAQGCG